MNKPPGLWKRLLDVGGVVFGGWDLEEQPGGDEVLVLAVRPDAAHRDRCSRCGRRAPRRDSGDGPRRWRAPDLGVTRCYLEAGAPRVTCPEHGVVVAAVPWARAGSRFTSAFEEQAAWLCARMPVSSAAVLLRTTWRALQGIIERVTTGLAAGRDRLEGLRRIGVDEKAWRKGHRYITVITDHDTGRLVWAAEGRNQDTLRKFFDDLGPERSARLEQVSADGAEWIHAVVAEKAPQAVICLDPFISSSGPLTRWTSSAGAWRASFAPPAGTGRPPPSRAPAGR
jgi:transposase